MRVGLIDVDGKTQNLALMKLSAWHKAKGHNVSWYTPIEAAFEPFDIVYASKIFTFTPDYPYIPEHAILGGTGYGDPLQLPLDVEHIMPDYSLYKMDYSLGFTSRGCSNNCGFCIVPKKEGKIREHSTLSEFVQHRKVVLQDNNFLASPHAEDKLFEMIERKLIVDFNQGLDIRLLNEKFACLLARLNPPELRFAWDYVGIETTVRCGISLLKNAGFPINRHRISMYVLCNYGTNLKEDLHRVEVLRSLDVRPFVMVFNKAMAPRVLRELATWCNRPRYFYKYKRFNEWLTVRKQPLLEYSA